MPTLQSLHATEIKDSRGRPTIRVTAISSDHNQAAFCVPSGASTGASEAVELRDESGSVSPAIKAVNHKISDALIGVDIVKQTNIDETMINLDGTDNKSRLGGNAILAVSGACCRLAAKVQDKKLYQYIAELSDNSLTKPNDLRLFINLINGGKHANNAGPFQEHQIVVESNSQQLSQQIGRQVQNNIRNYLNDNNIIFTIGDEGGFVFPFDQISTPFKLLHDSLQQISNNKANVVLGADIAASSFYLGDNRYQVFDNVMNVSNLVNLYTELFDKYKLHYIEDPFDEADFSSFTLLGKKLPGSMIVGDDLTTTNSKRLQTAIDKKSLSALIIKPNQIGTVTETIATIKLAHRNNIKTIVSHRSGETMDDFIADLAVGAAVFGIKAGAWGQPEREAKYDRLLEIESELSN
jgi:enolase